MKVKDAILYEEYANFPTKGVSFIDLTPSLLVPELTDQMIIELMSLYGDKVIDYIISPDARGFIWGGMVASKYGLGFIPVRKAGKLPDAAIQNSIKYDTEYSTTELTLPKVDIAGKQLLFVDDVYATGGTYRAIKEMVTKQQANLIGGAVVVDIELDHNPEIKSLIKVKEFKR